MPNAKYLSDAMTREAVRRSRPHQDERGAFEAWAAGLPDDQLRGAFRVLVEELARRLRMDPQKLRVLLDVARQVAT